MRVLILFCALLGLRGFGIAYATLSALEQYRSLGVAGAPLPRVGLYALWGLLFIRLAWGLRQRQRWAYRGFPWALAGQLSFDLIWLAVYAQADFDRERIPFQGVTSAVIMGLALWWWSRLRRYFGVQYDELTRT